MRKGIKAFVLFLFCLIYLDNHCQENKQNLNIVSTSLDKLKKDFDEVVLFNSESYWSDDFIIYGVGCVDEMCKTLKIKYSLDEESRIVLKKIKSRKKTDQNIVINLRSKLKTLSNDSLNSTRVNSKTGLNVSVSDGDKWSILYMNGDYKLYRHSYMPEYYQQLNHINQRQQFIELYNSLQKLSIKKRWCLW